LAAYNGAERGLLPVPATFVIDRDGMVRFAFADTDYRRRVEPEAIVGA
jgi:peroxiredoxin